MNLSIFLNSCFGQSNFITASGALSVRPLHRQKRSFGSTSNMQVYDCEFSLPGEHGSESGTTCAENVAMRFDLFAFHDEGGVGEQRVIEQRPYFLHQIDVWQLCLRPACSRRTSSYVGLAKTSPGLKLDCAGSIGLYVDCRHHRKVNVSFMPLFIYLF